MKLNPERVDFESRDTTGRTLLFPLVNCALLNAGDIEKVLRCIEWFVSCGATPLSKCSKSSWSLTLHKRDKGVVGTVEYSNHTAISYVRAWLTQLAGKAELAREFDALGRVLEGFATAIPKQKTARVSVHEGLAELWEKYLAAKTSHDLTFKTADGEVTAHAQILKEASSVISAMLASPMKEGQAQAIWVKDASSSGVSLFLEMLVAYSEMFMLFHYCFIMLHPYPLYLLLLPPLPDRPFLGFPVLKSVIFLWKNIMFS